MLQFKCSGTRNQIIRFFSLVEIAWGRGWRGIHSLLRWPWSQAVWLLVFLQELSNTFIRDAFQLQYLIVSGYLVDAGTVL